MVVSALLRFQRSEAGALYYISLLTVLSVVVSELSHRIHLCDERWITVYRFGVNVAICLILLATSLRYDELYSTDLRLDKL